ncbi:aspartate/glutamate racemase family protein [Parendozoicomonas haliclonae]|uniref:Aspartate racemase n=1 Tax=Parendozoicomonas haliclonae TaxID=1960125 RepID=A0A1X7AL94_9GAMM|nr:amino acid racemase [Parendozoicomonas haliclonae]SMA48241.1 Aspartate racemase [Parendozoicomonas haliclonae]
MLGILGGMGPLATIDFMQKVVLGSQVGCDQEHIPILVHNVPQIPDRTRFILSGGEDPFPAMLDGLRRLEASGASCVVIPCNTAHYWFERLQAETSMIMISILDCVLEEVALRGLHKVGIMATSATVSAGMYQKRLEQQGCEAIIPDELNQERMMAAIYAVKAGRMAEGTEMMEAIFASLQEQGAEAVVLGCTEIPVGLARLALEQPELCLDATALLANACVYWYYDSHALAA